jgi:hypothetical protein
VQFSVITAQFSVITVQFSVITVQFSVIIVQKSVKTDLIGGKNIVMIKSTNQFKAYIVEWNFQAVSVV